MVRGQADYGGYQEKVIGATLADMADLAARLGSIVAFDRRGDVIYLDDYEAPIRKYLLDNSPACSAMLDSTAAVSGAQCVQFLTDGTSGRHAGLRHLVAALLAGKHGIKISASLHDMQLADSDYSFWIDTYDGAHRFVAGIRINLFAQTLEYINGLNVWTVLEPAFISISAHPQTFHDMKLVVDLDAGRYVRFMYDVWTWEMEQYLFHKPASLIATVNRINFRLTDNTGQIWDAYQDDFVYTINEP